eukprot:TRINITY_DN22489_c0_g1_i1.p1 TRINITY_DN22489_c0_g1~~TRINITY_DN22489_c0_g1_i1.p1  ORF type:complete len:1048 (+),score=214.18 TRINITY_DN22489_c0_g1_i1:136-3144(+)
MPAAVEHAIQVRDRHGQTSSQGRGLLVTGAFTLVGLVYAIGSVPSGADQMLQEIQDRQAAVAGRIAAIRAASIGSNATEEGSASPSTSAPSAASPPAPPSEPLTPPNINSTTDSCAEIFCKSGDFDTDQLKLDIECYYRRRAPASTCHNDENMIRCHPMKCLYSQSDTQVSPFPDGWRGEAKSFNQTYTRMANLSEHATDDTDGRNLSADEKGKIEKQRKAWCQSACALPKDTQKPSSIYRYMAISGILLGVILYGTLFDCINAHCRSWGRTPDKVAVWPVLPSFTYNPTAGRKSFWAYLGCCCGKDRNGEPGVECLEGIECCKCFKRSLARVAGWARNFLVTLLHCPWVWADYLRRGDVLRQLVSADPDKLECEEGANVYRVCALIGPNWSCCLCPGVEAQKKDLREKHKENKLTKEAVFAAHHKPTVAAWLTIVMVNCCVLAMQLYVPYKLVAGSMSQYHLVGMKSKEYWRDHPPLGNIIMIMVPLLVYGTRMLVNIEKAIRTEFDQDMYLVRANFAGKLKECQLFDNPFGRLWTTLWLLASFLANTFVAVLLLIYIVHSIAVFKHGEMFDFILKVLGTTATLDIDDELIEALPVWLGIWRTFHPKIAEEVKLMGTIKESEEEASDDKETGSDEKHPGSDEKHWVRRAAVVKAGVRLGFRVDSDGVITHIDRLFGIAPKLLQRNGTVGSEGLYIGDKIVDAYCIPNASHDGHSEWKQRILNLHQQKQKPPVCAENTHPSDAGKSKKAEGEWKLRFAPCYTEDTFDADGKKIDRWNDSDDSGTGMEIEERRKHKWRFWIEQLDPESKKPPVRHHLPQPWLAMSDKPADEEKAGKGKGEKERKATEILSKLLWSVRGCGDFSGDRQMYPELIFFVVEETDRFERQHYVPLPSVCDIPGIKQVANLACLFNHKPRDLDADSGSPRRRDKHGKDLGSKEPVDPCEYPDSPSARINNKNWAWRLLVVDQIVHNTIYVCSRWGMIASYVFIYFAYYVDDSGTKVGI